MKNIGLPINVAAARAAAYAKRIDEMESDWRDELYGNASDAELAACADLYDLRSLAVDYGYDPDGFGTLDELRELRGDG